MGSRIRRYYCVATLALGLAMAPGQPRAQTIDILAAASTTEAVTALATAVQKAHGIDLRATFAASSTLAKQIAAGAPVHLFLSANPEWMQYLQDRDLLADKDRLNLLGNRLVLLRRADDGEAVKLTALADLKAALGEERLIMGDPEHVPAGRYGRQALRKLGLWPAVRSQAVFGASVRDALALLARGQGRYAIAYATDAQVHGGLARAAAFPSDSHDAIVYPLALIRGRDSAPARAVFRFLRGQAAGKIFEQYGFTFLPRPR
ncbi:MAG: molybdate ABC transporter substrate-binding protein [Alphaproteobacteria bacterium]|jgi:molybdate transport system substrate-binding protein|nr:molybdate ABC transporter substrate-binding protein [Alphaproteobacteria bacterium]